MDQTYLMGFRRSFDFGDEIWQTDRYSMFFEELRDIPKLYPSLKETGFYIAGSNWFSDLIITPLIFVGLKLAPKCGTPPAWKTDVVGHGKSRPPYVVALKVEAKGLLNGRQVEVHVRIAHPDGYEFTAIPVVAYLKQYLDGSARCDGVHMMGHIAEPLRLFKDMQAMGVELNEHLTG